MSCIKKSFSGQKVHPPSRVNLSKCLYEKMVDAFALFKIAHACSDCLKPKCLYGEKLAWIGG